MCTISKSVLKAFIFDLPPKLNLSNARQKEGLWDVRLRKKGSAKATNNKQKASGNHQATSNKQQEERKKETSNKKKKETRQKEWEARKGKEN